LLLAATLWAYLWAGRQPRVHSIWGDPPEKPLSGNYGRVHSGQQFCKDKNDSYWN
jgi:hypothetical protein